MSKEGSKKPEKNLGVKQRLAKFKLLDMLGFTFFYSLSILIINAALDSLGTAFLLIADFALALPVATIFMTIQAGLALREAQSKNWRAHPLIRFAVEAFNALVLISLTLLTGLYIANPSSAVLSSLVSAMFPTLIIALATRTIYNISSGIYYFNKGLSADNEEKQLKADSKAIQHLLNGLAFGCITAVWTALCFFPLAITPPILTLGLLAGALTVAVAIYQLYDLSSRPDSRRPIDSTENTFISGSSVTLCKNLGVNHKPKAEVSEMPVKTSCCSPFFQPSSLPLEEIQESWTPAPTDMSNFTQPTP